MRFETGVIYPDSSRLNPEYVLNTAAHSGSRAVASLLPIRKGSIAIALVMQVFAENIGPQVLYFLFRTIGGIRPYATAGVGFIQQLIKHLAVVNRCVGHGVVSDELVFHVYVNMILVTIVGNASLLRPARIHILLPPLRFTPVVEGIALLDLLILVPTLALFGHGHDTRVHDLTLLGRKAMLGKKRIELHGNRFDQTDLLQPLTKQPEGLGVRNGVAKFYP